MERSGSVDPCGSSHSVAGSWCSVSGSAGIRRSALGASPPSSQPADCEESCGGPLPARCPAVSLSHKKGSPRVPDPVHLDALTPALRVLSSGLRGSSSRCSASEPGQSNSVSLLLLPLFLLSTPPSAETKCFLCCSRRANFSKKIARVKPEVILQSKVFLCAHVA